MKRCPQCDFIYEDEQNVCDMDGSELVLDKRVMPRAEEAALRYSIIPAKGRRRRFFLLSLLGGVMSVALLFNDRGVNNEAARVPTQPAEPAVAVKTSPIAVSHIVAPTSKTDSRTSAKGANKSLVEPATKTTPGRARNSRASASEIKPPIERTNRKDSKIGSFLKKTVRILKKPF
jgi:hypothetical protein